MKSSFVPSRGKVVNVIGYWFAAIGFFAITRRNFMSDSTLRRSLNPIPQGLPGVASSMNRPNSGWNVGSLVFSLRKTEIGARKMGKYCLPGLQVRDAPAALVELLISCESF